jgi:hypothetical protein
MRSPLEFDPELISGAGLITARWAALESVMAEVLGNLLKVESAGPHVYYALSNFSQRVDFVQEACKASFTSEKHCKISDALFAKVKRLWKTRNYLIHSHYVYVAPPDRDGRQSVLLNLSKDGGPSPKDDFIGAAVGGRSSIGQLVNEKLPVGFAYEERKLDGAVRYVPVNKGTFQNHAAQLSKRARQMNLLRHALLYEMVPLRRTTWTLPSRLPPRSRLDQMGPLVILAPDTKH